MARRRYDKIYHYYLWLTHRLTDRQLMMVLAVVVGLAAGLGTYIFEILLHFIRAGLVNWFPVERAQFLYLIYPAVGIILATLFVKYVVKDNISEGVTRVLYAMSRSNSRIRGHNCWTSVVGGATTIGFGGSVGAEAPIVLTGSAIGSNLGSLFKMEHRTLMLLVGCGAAGAVAGIFKAPIAGLVFTLEVLMIDLTMGSLLPLLVSSVTAATVAYILHGTEAMFEFHMDEPFLMERIPAVMLLGILCGLVSLYFTRSMNWFENIFRRYSNPYTKLLLGGTLLSILIFLFPPLYGEGYDTISLLLNGTTEQDWDMVMNNSIFYGDGRLLLLYLSFIVLLKVFATTATNGGGGCGGTFAPSLFLGCIVGFVFANFCNGYSNNKNHQEGW